MFQDVLAECPDHNWKLIFALSRLAGMRCPSEVTRLQWDDVLFDEGKLRINSPKTGRRFCPILPELLPILRAAKREYPVANTRCVYRYSVDANFSTTLRKAIVRAGYLPWPKMFINLRSSRRMELQENFPSHVVDSWLGHSTAVAEKHCLQVTEDHWDRATEDDQEESARTPAADGLRLPVTAEEMLETMNMAYSGSYGQSLAPTKLTPTGLEPVLPP